MNVNNVENRELLNADSEMRVGGVMEHVENNAAQPYESVLPNSWLNLTSWIQERESNEGNPTAEEDEDEKQNIDLPSNGERERKEEYEVYRERKQQEDYEVYRYDERKEEKGYERNRNEENEAYRNDEEDYETYIERRERLEREERELQVRQEEKRAYRERRERERELEDHIELQDRQFREPIRPNRLRYSTEFYSRGDIYRRIPIQATHRDPISTRDMWNEIKKYCQYEEYSMDDVRKIQKIVRRFKHDTGVRFDCFVLWEDVERVQQIIDGMCSITEFVMRPHGVHEARVIRKRIFNNDNPRSITWNAQKIRVVTWNINGFQNKIAEISEMVQRNEWDIIGFQETRKVYRPYIPGYKQYHYGNMNIDHSQAGIGLTLVVRNELAHVVEVIHREETCLCIRVNVTNPMVLCMIYRNWRSNIQNQLNHFGQVIDTIWREGVDQDLVVMGDFNAELQEGHVQRWCEEYGLNVSEYSTPRITRPDSDRAIDYILLNERIRGRENVRTRVIESDLSDHFPVETTIQVNWSGLENNDEWKKPRRYNKKVLQNDDKKERFWTELCSNRFARLANTANTESHSTKFDRWEKGVQEALKVVGGWNDNPSQKVHKKKIKYPEWYTTECRRISRSRRMMFKKMQRLRRQGTVIPPELRERYKRKKTEGIRLNALERRRTWNELLAKGEVLWKTDTRGFYKWLERFGITKRNKSTSPLPILNGENVLCTGEAGKEAWRDHFERLAQLREQHDTEELVALQSRFEDEKLAPISPEEVKVETLEGLNDPITGYELMEAMRGVADTAAGEDEFSNGLLKRILEMNEPPPQVNENQHNDGVSENEDEESDSSVSSINEDAEEKESEEELLIRMQRILMEAGARRDDQDFERGREWKQVERPNESVRENKPAIQALINIFNGVLDTGKWIQSWCKASIVPIPKKGNLRSPDNWRGISLMSCVAKLFLRVLTRRIVNKLEEVRYYIPEQAGFRFKRDCPEQMAVLREVIERRRNTGLETHVAFLDLTKAYDSVHHGALLYKMAKAGIGGKILRVFRNLYRETKINVLVGNQASNEAPYKVGVRQGCVSSPCLFNIFINDVLDEIISNEDLGVTVPGLEENDILQDEKNKRTSLAGLLFADDLVLLGSSSDSLQDSIDKVEEWSKSWGMRFNIPKCGVIKVSGINNDNEEDDNSELHLQGENIPQVDAYTYLGSEFQTEDLTVDAEVEKRATIARKVVFALRSVLQNRALSLKAKRAVLMTKVIPVVLWGSEAWFTSDQQLVIAQKWVNLACKWMIGLKMNDKVCEGVIRMEAGVRSLSFYVRKRQIRAMLKWQEKNHSWIQALVLSKTRPVSRKQSFMEKIQGWFKKYLTVEFDVEEGFESEAVRKLIIRDLRFITGMDHAGKQVLKPMRTAKQYYALNFHVQYGLDLGNDHYKGRTMWHRFRTKCLWTTRRKVEARLLGNEWKYKCPVCGRTDLPGGENRRHIVLYCDAYRSIREEWAKCIREQVGEWMLETIRVMPEIGIREARLTEEQKYESLGILLGGSFNNGFSINKEVQMKMCRLSIHFLQRIMLRRSNIISVSPWRDEIRTNNNVSYDSRRCGSSRGQGQHAMTRFHDDRLQLS